MCGGEESLRIEPADNGFIVHAYTPGKNGGSGVHRDLIASDADHALRLARPHVAKMRKRKSGERELTAEGPKLGGHAKRGKAKGRRKRATKRV